ncbi:hypothetical protein [Pseudoalteromonas sp. MMG005]|uniref:hypothetical protein n=1 Tax=Pseudoalteromonas sp. MMG005 TaxID=2822682 RepID=UPI001B39F4CB|nr:hypothetical protein [Pseudoalteromonas sp. MMG005]MBQ4845390.1 hypothetical protein [Pseudoalteromonas sp. MMG005]
MRILNLAVLLFFLTACGGGSESSSHNEVRLDATDTETTQNGEKDEDNSKMIFGKSKFNEARLG